MKILLKLMTFSLIVVSISGCKKNEEPQDDDKKYYYNPVLGFDCADPTVIDDRERTGYFYAYSTRAIYNSKTYYLPVHRSKDMYNWEPFVADGWDGKPPTWAKPANCWAPDINYVNGQYILYYAQGSETDVHLLSGSGVAVSDSPTGPFVDKGMVVDYATTGVKLSIDPMLFIDGDNKYLYWGSFGSESGIWVVELEDDALSVKKGAKPVQIGCGNMEGSYVKKKDGYYYFFGSMGSCCSGEESTYHIIVARADNPFGPFVSRTGVSLMNSGYNQTIMQSSPDKMFRGTGHNAQIFTDDAGSDWMYYHSYCSRTTYRGRLLCMDQIVWDKDGWPSFKYGSWPTSKYEIPVIKTK